MKIKVKKNSIYKEVIIEDGNTIISTGLLDKEESQGLIEEFQNAIDSLKE